MKTQKKQQITNDEKHKRIYKVFVHLTDNVNCSSFSKPCTFCPFEKSCLLILTIINNINNLRQNENN